MKTHHMVNTKDSAVPQVMAQVPYGVVVASFSNFIGMKRREFPNLTLGKDGVWGRTGRKILNKQAALAPNIITIGVDSQWQVKI